MLLHYLVIFVICLFSDINVAQGTAETYARCRGIFRNRFTPDLPNESAGERILIIG